MNNNFDPRVNDVETYLQIHQSYSLRRSFRSEKSLGDCKLISAKGKTCKQLSQDTEKLLIPGFDQLLAFLKKKTCVPVKWKGKRVFFFGDIFLNGDGYPFVFFLDCCSSELEYGICQLYHEHPFNQDDFVAVFTEYEKFIQDKWIDSKTYKFGLLLLRKGGKKILFDKDLDKKTMDFNY